MNTDLKEKKEIETKQYKKTRKNFIKEAKEIINLDSKKRIRNPDDVNSTIRMPRDLRQQVAQFCIENKISMNKLIINLLKEEIKSNKK